MTPSAQFRIVLPSGERLADRIRLSTGTTPGSGVELEPGAVIPRPPWRNPTASELARMEADDFSSSHEIVAVVRLDFDLKAHFGPLRALAALEPCLDAIRDRAANPINQAATAALHAYINEHFRVAVHPQETAGPLGGICVKAPGRLATTVDSQTRRGVGLHLDNWSRLPFPDRSSAENRICVNLGEFDRRLLFIDVPIAEMYRTLKNAPDLSALPFGQRRGFYGGVKYTF